VKTTDTHAKTLIIGKRKSARNHTVAPMALVLTISHIMKKTKQVGKQATVLHQLRQEKENVND